ncbi:MAG: HAD family hydrolase [Desulfobacula sp.]|jgi:HAD superfamily hydrolase (TIGR01549 family)|uniref:HAD family hydrolase n=1 Tax=Desulfobacula sp. TaxID=2593537 RepID=UPI001DC001E2|nr:HAD family hydrolase [Desulfobacula sp.]MBT3485232.1 HAD family hydrolase [Desulfobacula sp.]MBT4025239.1 HAD family hydrolase [Desulfobacula sp.]MBT4200111.1 HAD family hydrolase [Desulfobacula sp.]MBT4507170.1 HAD family hydrolase [Desulfobacula sp.]
MDILKIKAVVFDCDGVMFDTALANRKYYDEVLQIFGKPRLNEEQFINIHMMTIRGAIEYLFPEMDDLSSVYDNLKNIGYKKFIKFMSMEKGLKELLIKLKDKGYIRGIATNRTNTMEKVLEDYGLEDYFEVVVTAAKVKKPKPDPEQLLLIMEKFELKPDEIFFIGDSDYDQQAAVRAKVRFAAFKNPDLKAEFYLESMDDIAEIFQINQ